MKTIDIVSIVALFIIFFLIYEGGGGMSGWQKNFESSESAKDQAKEGQKERPTPVSDTPPSTDLKSYESYFEQGLPAEYAPKSPENFPDIEKLRQDLEYRRQKLEFAITQERKEMGDFDGPEVEKSAALSALSEKHRQARHQLDQLHSKIMDEYQEKRKHEGSRNQDLR